MTMGKGGVGKTTIAAAIAVALADRGHQVTLSTTDPAAHLTDALGNHTPDSLTVERIDPTAETERYSNEVLAAAVGVDAEGHALLAEDLRSPCTEEIAVFPRVRTDRRPGRGPDRRARHRPNRPHAAAARRRRELPAGDQTHQRPGPRQRPRPCRACPRPDYARVIILTLPESTPIHEAQRLQTDLRRAGIEPYGWLVNSSLTGTHTHHPTLRARAQAEQPHLNRVDQLSGTQTWLVTWQPEQPTGTAALRNLATSHPTAFATTGS